MRNNRYLLNTRPNAAPQHQQRVSSAWHDSAPVTPPKPAFAVSLLRFVGLSLALLLLTVSSLFIGVGRLTPAELINADTAAQAWELLIISRVPRTLALLLAGASLAVAGLIMQMMVRNRFVEPSTAGTTESATLGILVVILFAPAAPVLVKMVVATGFALIGTAVFLRILRHLPPQFPYLVPVVGLVLGGVIQAITTFVAYQFDLLQSLHTWTTGDFSGVIQGRYELLWLGLALSIAAYLTADRFTLLGLGKQFSTNLGLRYQRSVAIGLVIVAAISSVVIVTAGGIPFLGLLIPNIVSLFCGDQLRRTLPWVAYFGAVFVLVCDMVGRMLYYPHEIPIGTVVGVVGSALFLYLLLNKRVRFV